MGGEPEGVEYNETSGQTRTQESVPDPLDSQHDRAQCPNPSLSSVGSAEHWTLHSRSLSQAQLSAA